MFGILPGVIFVALGCGNGSEPVDGSIDADADVAHDADETADGQLDSDPDTADGQLDSAPDTDETADADSDGDMADGDTDSNSECSPPEPPLPEVTWDVLAGPVPEGASLLQGDGRDESDAIQAILDGAVAGEVVFFPRPASFYGISNTVHVNASIELRGAGFGPGSVRDGTAEQIGAELRALEELSSMLEVRSDHVTVRGLRFVGTGRPLPVDGRPTRSGIAVVGELERPLRGVTVEDNDLTSFDNRCIDLYFVEGYIVRNNRCVETGYAGIFVWGSRYGLITGNRIIDVAGAMVGRTGENNAYPIVISGRDTVEQPACAYTIISNNYVEDSPEWTGIMDHGGRYTLMMDNEVHACDFGLAFTGPGDHCLSINNLNVDSPRRSHWNIARDHVGIIGNVFRRATSMHLGGQNLVITDNRVEEEVGSRRATLGRYAPVSAYEARNDWGTQTDWDTHDTVTWLEGASTPEPPRELRVEACGSEYALTWDYSTSVSHHAFLIEQSTDGTTWATLAYRPPHDGTWSFDTDAHHGWEPLDTLRYVTAASTARYYRIRAHHGDATSDWSNIAELE